MKKNPLKGDYTHLHHRLLGLGRNRKEIRAFVWIWSLIMMVLMLLQGTDRFNKVVIFGMMALVFFGINFYLFKVKKLPCGLQMKK
jgi:UDP-GlcNAc:undecaprenyl-phosphate/decaprenyl-phosphate GlcNAc-1-phosphate transferase